MPELLTDRLSLLGLQFDCVLGVYAHERDAPQAVRLDVTLHLDTRAAAHSGQLSESVDYARLAGELRFLLVASRFRLMESAAEAVARYVLAPPIADSLRPQVSACEVTLSKLQALDFSGRPQLTIHRRASEVELKRETKEFGFIDIILEVEEVGVYRERVSAGKTVPTHVHRGLDEAELVLGEGLLVQGKPATPGQARSWPRGYAHRWDNPTAREQSFLCIDRPRFVHTDEIEVAVPTEQLLDVEPVRFF